MSATTGLDGLHARLRKLKRLALAVSLAAFGVVSSLVISNPVGATRSGGSGATSTGTTGATDGTEGRTPGSDDNPGQAPSTAAPRDPNAFFGSGGRNPGLFGGRGGGSATSPNVSSGGS